MSDVVGLAPQVDEVIRSLNVFLGYATFREVQGGNPRRGILFEGPPGTGKTHTIANLLGYLLAQGKTVLVTAHTTKALRVLRQQVDKALQPLCLSVLGRDSESQAQMKESAQEIANRLSSSNAATLRKQAALLREKRCKLLDAASALRRQLRDARFSEVEEIVVPYSVANFRNRSRPSPSYESYFYNSAANLTEPLFAPYSRRLS